MSVKGSQQLLGYFITVLLDVEVAVSGLLVDFVFGLKTLKRLNAFGHNHADQRLCAQDEQRKNLPESSLL